MNTPQIWGSWQTVFVYYCIDIALGCWKADSFCSRLHSLARQICLSSYSRFVIWQCAATLMVLEGFFPPFPPTLMPPTLPLLHSADLFPATCHKQIHKGWNMSGCQPSTCSDPQCFWQPWKCDPSFFTGLILCMVKRTLPSFVSCWFLNWHLHIGLIFQIQDDISSCHKYTEHFCLPCVISWLWDGQLDFSPASPNQEKSRAQLQ